MNNIKVTFAIISYNAETTIERCIKSIINLPYSNKEILLIDDNSSDLTRSIASQFPVKIIIKDKNQKGIGWSRNIAIESAKGEYLFIIDSDIEIISCDIQDILMKFEEDNLLMGISGNYFIANSDSNNLNYLLDIRRKLIYRKSHNSFEYNLDQNYTTFSGGFSCIRLNLPVIPKFLNNNEANAEDLIWQINLLNKGYKFLYLGDFKGLHHHYRIDSAISKINTELKGSLWLIKYSAEQNLKLPILESLNNIPLIFILSICTVFMSPILGIFLLSLDLLPYTSIIFNTEINFNAKLKFFYFVLIKRFWMIYYFIKNLTTIFKSTSSFKILKIIILSDIESKFNYIKYSLVKSYVN